MTGSGAYTVKVKFPGDLEYIPSIRKFISEILQVSSLNQKFAFRSEIIVDEVCNNAVNYGCASPDAQVELACTILNEHVEFRVKDEGGRKVDVERLRTAVSEERKAAAGEGGRDKFTGGLGLEIVRMLSEQVDLEIDENNLTSVRVVRRREELEASDRK